MSSSWSGTGDPPPGTGPGPEPAPASPSGALEGARSYEEVQASPEFAALRRRFRRVVFPLSALFLAWYAAYVLLADYAHDFMGIRLGGSNITVGLLFGFGQFASTFIITTIYVRWANKRFDPAADELRHRIEGTP
ncbi:DUF485 domain-containing protein [Kineococcus gynurae]|uniref:DUF485 domain-containing protein n=1 Tax=Kineococcus gynurae TaxID=452979 RepID=A0ABV5LWM9_9ACTN